MRFFTTIIFFWTFSLIADELKVERLSDFPSKEGVTAAFNGIVDNCLVVAGGCNFPNGKPWEGGKKVWESGIYYLENKDAEWKLAGHQQVATSYGASISTKNGLLCLGGMKKGALTDEVNLIKAVSPKLIISKKAPLPMPLAVMGSTTFENRIYIFGGKTTTGNIAKCWSASLPYSGNWRAEADIPFGAIAKLNIGKIDNKIIVFGGQFGSGLANFSFNKTVYTFTPKTGTWKKVTEGLISLVTPTTSTKDAIIMFGQGGSAELSLHQRMINAKQMAKLDKDSAEFARLKEHTRLLMKHDRGHSGVIWKFSLKQKTWTPIGKLPNNCGAVGTKALKWQGGIVIPGGELRPGVRTNRVLFIRGT